MTFNVSLKKTISCELNNAVVHTFVLSFRTQMLSNWPILPVAGAVRSYYRAASFLRLPETLFIASVWPARPRSSQDHTRASHPAICPHSFLPGLIFASRCPGPSGPLALRTLHMPLADISTPAFFMGQWERYFCPSPKTSNATDCLISM